MTDRKTLPTEKIYDVRSDDDDDKYNKVFLRTEFSCGRQRIIEHALLDTGCRRNLLNLSALLRLGKNAPRIRPCHVRMTGANDEELNVLGFVYLNMKFAGTRDRLVKFHIIEDLACNAIIGREIIINQHIEIFLDKQHIVLDKVKVPLLLAEPAMPAKVKTQITLQPGEQKPIRAFKTGKTVIKGVYMAVPRNKYQHCLVNTIIDLKKSNNMEIWCSNTSSHPITFEKGTIIADVEPCAAKYKLHLLSDEDLSEMRGEIQPDTCFAVKTGKRKKPTHSRPYVEDDGRSDESIIREQLKYNRDLLTPEEQDRLLNLVIRYKDCFSLRGEIGESKSFEYRIRMKKDAEHFFKQAYRVSAFEKDILKEELAKLMKLGIVEKANSSGYIPMCSPALLVAKSDQSARLVCDFRKLNQSMIPHHESFATIAELLSRIGHANPKYLSSFDLADSFFNIRLHEDSRDYTTFTPYSQCMLRYARVPQGLKNAPAALQAMTSAVYGDLQFVLMYADDLLIMSHSKSSLFSNLETFLKRTLDDGIKLSLKKSNLVDTKCVFLGHYIEGTTVSPLDKHVEAIRNLPTPTNKSSLRRILGSIQWLKSYIPSCSAKTHRLYNLLRKNVEFEWTKQHAQDLEEIKKVFTTKPILQLPRGTGQYILFTDASHEGLAGTLLERHSATECNVVGYCSRALTNSEKKLSSVSELELLAITFSVKFFHDLLYNPKSFQIWTDHKSLKSIITGTKRHTTKRISLMVSQLSEYNFDLFYVPGEKNQMADMLSRNLLVANRAEALSNELTAPVSDNIPPRRSRRAQKLAPEFGQYEKAARKDKGQAKTKEPSSSADTELRRSARVAAKRSDLTVVPPVPMMKQHSTGPGKRGRPRKTPAPEEQETVISSGLADDDSSAPIAPPDPVVPAPPSKDPTELLSLPDYSQIYGTVPDKFLKDDRPLYDIGPSLDGMASARNPSVTTEYSTVDQQLIDDPKAKITFSPKFAGSVPRATRQKIIEMAKADYSVNIDRNDVRRHQRMDPYFKPLITYLTDRVLPANKMAAKRILVQEDHYCMISDLLFRLPNPESAKLLNKFKLQLVIPESLSDSIIWKEHCQTYGVSHSGYLKCLNAIKKKYYIYDLGNKLRRLMKSCGLCLKVRGSNRQNCTMPLQIAAAKSCDGPFQALQIDHATDIPSHLYKAKHLLVITCEWSGYVWCFPCETTGAKEAAKYVNLLFRRYGICERMASDRGPAFIAAIFQALTAVYKYKYTAHVSYSANSTGHAESHIKRVKLQISHAKLLNPSVEIFSILHDIEFSLNCGAQLHATGVTPFFAFHGFEAKLPGDIDITGVIPKNAVVFTEELKEQVSLRKELITNARKIASMQMKYDHDSKIQKLPDFRIGQMVLLKSHRHPDDCKSVRKWKIKESGPFIIHNIDGMNCLLRSIDRNTGKQTVIPDLFSLRHLKTIDSYRDSFPVDSCKAISDSQTVNIKARLTGKRRFKDHGELVLLRPEDTRYSFWYPTQRIRQLKMKLD